MLVNGPENDKLFAKTIPVSLKDDYTNQIRTSHLFLTMEWQEASAGMYGRRMLAIRLTDNNDPFFLYNLHLSEEDFQMLKTSQELLINFASFPQHIIGYIEKCLFEEKNPQHKFLLVFSLNDKLGGTAAASRFDIIETNQLRNLTHLSLKFVAASESEIKQYISTCFRNLKEAKQMLENNLDSSEREKREKLSAKEDALNRMEQELETLRKHHIEELLKKDNQHSEELQEEKKRLLDKLQDEQDRFERERRNKEHQFQKEIQELQSREQLLSKLNKELQDKNYKHESTIRDLRTSVLTLEGEIRRLKDSIQSYRLKNDNLQSELKDKQKHIKSLDKEIHDLRQEIESKAQSIAKLNQQIESEIDQKELLEGELEMVRDQLDMSERAQKMLNKEKDDLSRTIINLQEKARKSKFKIELATKYKQQIEEKDKLLQDIRKETLDLNLQLEAKNIEINSLKDSVKTFQVKIDDLEKELKGKAHLFKWMHGILTENNIFPHYTPQSNINISPSNVAQKQLAEISYSAGQNSSNPNNSSPVATSNKTVPKSVSVDTPSPIYGYGSAVPHRFQNTGGTDSAYATSPSGYINQVSPGNVHDIPSTNCDHEDFDPEAFNAAFGQGEPILKHSTAKKPTKPIKPTKSVKSTTPNVSRKKR